MEVSAHGYIEWEGSKAQWKLKKDSDNDKHLQMSKLDLWSSRDCYHMELPLKVFRDHVYQEIRTRKYMYTLELKEKNKLEKKEKEKVENKV